VLVTVRVGGVGGGELTSLRGLLLLVHSGSDGGIWRRRWWHVGRRLENVHVNDGLGGNAINRRNCRRLGHTTAKKDKRQAVAVDDVVGKQLDFGLLGGRPQA
jgi:hypothetical protein